MTDSGTDEFPIEYEPRLVEEAVLAALRVRREEAEYRASRDALYAIADLEERETQFRIVHTAWFARLGLGEAVAGTLREHPSVRASASRCLVAFAPFPRDEGAELFVAPAGGAAEATQRTVVLRLRPETLADPDRLRTLLRHELLHVADMLDPSFGYTPLGLAVLSGPLPEPLYRERYRVLWDVLIDGRLEALGWAPPGTRAERFREFAATFPMLGDHTEEAFERFFGGAPGTHADLVAFAVEPQQGLGRGRRGPHPGERCPLCQCPTHAFEREPARLLRAVRERIQRRFPGWTPGDGLCPQCADLYGLLGNPTPRSGMRRGRREVRGTCCDPF